METWLTVLISVLGGTNSVVVGGGIVFCVLRCYYRSHNTRRNAEFEHIEQQGTQNDFIANEIPPQTDDNSSPLPMHPDYIECIGQSMEAPNFQFLPDGSRNFNCWGWAIQKITGQYIATNPPGFDETTRKNCSIQKFAKLTMEGVKTFGAENGEILGEISDDKLTCVINNLQENQYLIAMRITSTGAYHYIRYDKKFGWSYKARNDGGLFKLNGITPNNNKAWDIYLYQKQKVTTPNDDTNKLLRPYHGLDTYYIKVILKTGC
ncbi:MAG: hypothetical protein LBK29_03800 [Oscillospiraceae bacterium]|jgi:hypothetical protein|nr:hypothetical protein [Oscillospiraceae bacterium]